MAIDGCAASHNYWNGVRAVNAVVNVHNTSLIQNRDGVDASTFGIGTANVTIHSCVVSGGLYHGIKAGIGSDVSVVDSVIADTRNQGSAYGVRATNGGILRLTRNTITRNDTGVFNDSATLYSAGDNVVSGNTIESTGTISAITKV